MAGFPDPRPQGAPPRTSGGTTNNVPPVSPYVDSGLTVGNPPQQTITPTPPLTSDPPGNIRPLYAEDKVSEIEAGEGLAHTDADAQASNSWQPSHDLYRNNGNVKGPTTVGTPPPTPAPFSGGGVFPPD